MSFLKYFLQIYKMKQQFKRANGHNFTGLSRHSLIRSQNVIVGRGTYGNIIVKSYDDSLKLVIGNYCSIAPKVEFLLGIDHPLSFVSTFPFKAQILNCGIDADAVSKGDIVVGDDVWIGQNSLILSGVHISQGAVIAAGAVVTKDVPPYAVVGGSPARVLKYRFSEELIDELIKIDYSKLTYEMIREHENELYQRVEVKEQLAWLPQRD